MFWSWSLAKELSTMVMYEFVHKDFEMLSQLECGDWVSLQQRQTSKIPTFIWNSEAVCGSLQNKLNLQYSQQDLLWDLLLILVKVIFRDRIVLLVMIAEVLQGGSTHKDTENHWVNSKNNSFAIWRIKSLGTWFSITINAGNWMVGSAFLYLLLYIE